MLERGIVGTGLIAAKLGAVVMVMVIGMVMVMLGRRTRIVAGVYVGRDTATMRTITITEMVVPGGKNMEMMMAMMAMVVQERMKRRMGSVERMGFASCWWWWWWWVRRRRCCFYPTTGEEFEGGSASGQV